MLRKIFCLLAVIITVSSCGKKENEVSTSENGSTESVEFSDSNSKVPFSWEQIKKMIDSDKAEGKRDFICTEDEWKASISNYNQKSIETLKTRKYATPELIEAMSLIPRPFYEYNYEKNERRISTENDFNTILDIGWGATMSAPSIQSFMTANLKP